MGKPPWEKTDEEILAEFPSLRCEPELPYCWIQWKGTDVCADFHCDCGFDGHFDGDFMYHIQCPKCKQVFECDGHIKLHKMDLTPDAIIKIPEGDELE